MADDSLQYYDDDTLEDPMDLSSSNISNENTTNTKLITNENNVLNPSNERPSFIIGTGSDYNVDTNTTNTHFSNIRKLTDALNQNSDPSNNKLKTHFKLKRTMSPEFPLNQSNTKTDSDIIVNRPFPIQRAASDIHHDTLRIPQAVSTSRLNNLQTSTPMIANVASKEDFNSNNHKKSIQNLNINTNSDDSNLDSSLNLKIKKNQTIIKLPSESQIIQTNNNNISTTTIDSTNNHTNIIINNANSNTNSALQTPRIKNLSSMNKTDYFAAKLADATLEKTNRQDDQEENFVYEDLMLDNDKGNNATMSQTNKNTNNDGDEKNNDDKLSAKQSSKSVSVNNNFTSNVNQIPSGKNLTNQPSVIIDPTRLMINNQKSISSMTSSLNDKGGDSKIKNESTPILNNGDDNNQKNSLDNNLQSFNNTNKASNLSSVSNRPGNLMNNRHNFVTSTSHAGLNSKNDDDNNITTNSNTPDVVPQQLLRPSMMNLSTASSNNNLSQYKKMMQNNARHSSVTVGVLPQNRTSLKNTLLPPKTNDSVPPKAPSPSLTVQELNSGYSSNSNYNDILDYSSPTRNKTINDYVSYQSPVTRKFRNKSNRNSIIQEENAEMSSYGQQSMLPDYNNGNFLSLNDVDKQKLGYQGGNLQETELSSKYSTNQLPILPFDTGSVGHRVKESRTNSVVDMNYKNDMKKSLKNEPDFNKQNSGKKGDETIYADEDTDTDMELEVEDGNDDNNVFSTNFNNHLKKIMSESKQNSTELKSDYISESGKKHSNNLAPKTSNTQSDPYSTQSILTMTTTDQHGINNNHKKRFSNGENNYQKPRANTNKKGQNLFREGSELDMDEYDNYSKKSNLMLNSPVEMISKKSLMKPGFLDSASGRHSNAVNNYNNLHHFGLDDDYDEEDFDERSSFYYSYPARRNSNNISKTMTYTSTATSNLGRKIRSNKGYSYDDNKGFNPGYMYSGMDEMENENMKKHYSTDSQKLTSNKVIPNDSTITHEANNKYRDSNTQYTWGNNDMSYNDISEHRDHFSGPQNKHENGSEYMSLAVHDETERLHDDSKNFFYYDSIHDYYPNKNNMPTNDKKDNKNMDGNQFNNFYSPHDYYSNNNKNMMPVYMAKYMSSTKKPKTFWEKLKKFLLWSFWTFTLIMIGVGLGALLVSSNELQEFSVLDMYNGIVTQDEIIFDMSCIAHNPTLFSVYVEKSNLDIFAESEYLTGGKDDNDDDDSRETILLGSVYGFETEMVFKTGLFWRHFDIARTSIKLKNPGMSDDLTREVEERKVTKTLEPTKSRIQPIETPPPQKDTKLKKWKDISKYEFTLIVKGVAYYEAPMNKGQKTLPVQYQVVVNKGKHKV